MHQYCASVAVKSDGLIDTVLVVWTDDRATLSLNLSTSPSFPVFAVGPNPASYNLNLLSNANSYFDITISVIDATGRTIFPSKGIAGTPGISENLIDVSTLPSGFYFLKIDGSMNGKQFSRNEKFIIRRE